jgi:hypothetical protein
MNRYGTFFNVSSLIQKSHIMNANGKNLLFLTHVKKMFKLLVRNEILDFASILLRSINKVILTLAL